MQVFEDPSLCQNVSFHGESHSIGISAGHLILSSLLLLLSQLTRLCAKVSLVDAMVRHLDIAAWATRKGERVFCSDTNQIIPMFVIEMSAHDIPGPCTTWATRHWARVRSTGGPAWKVVDDVCRRVG